jgi:hypothetical protein
MNFKEAVKEAQKHKPAEHMMLINISYDKKLVLPFKDGLAFMATLQNAQIIEYNYSKPDRISQLDKDTIAISPMSQQDYQDLVIASLLNTRAAEVKKAREEALQQEYEANQQKAAA